MSVPQSFARKTYPISLEKRGRQSPEHHLAAALELKVNVLTGLLFGQQADTTGFAKLVATPGRHLREKAFTKALRPSFSEVSGLLGK
jgi:hypothetical protein